MKLVTCIFACLLALPTFAQKNDIGLFGVGNLNGLNIDYLKGQNNTPIVAGYASKAGGGIEYRRWILPQVAAGLWFESNPSTGIQYTSSLDPYIYDFPLERYEVGVPVTVRFWTKRKLNPFMQVGFGFVVTHAGPVANWSYDFNLLAGGGIDYELSSRWVARVGFREWDGTQGCFNDPTCASTIGQAQDVQLGAAYRW